MDTATFAEKLGDYAAEFKSWSGPITQYRKSRQRRPITGPADLENYYQELEDITKEQRAKYDLPELISAFLNQHYDVYLESTPNECSKIRALCEDNDAFKGFLLFSYVRQTVSQLQATGRQEWLLRGLVAMSLEDSSDDYRDTLTALAELFVTAEQHGIAPKSSFQRVGKLSNREIPRGGPIPVSEMMMEFDTYPIVKERRKRRKSYWEK